MVENSFLGSVIYVLANSVHVLKSLCGFFDISKCTLLKYVFKVRQLYYT